MMDEKDPPVEPLDYRHGPTVVDIGDVRVSRGMSRRPHSSCKHMRMCYDTHERRIWCQDCERDVEPFDAFKILVEHNATAWAKIKRRLDEVKAAESASIRSRAAKALDEVWRTRNMVPACPTCSHGLLPEMFANGVGTRLGRDYAEARINAAKGNPPE